MAFFKKQESKQKSGEPDDVVLKQVEEVAAKAHMAQQTPYGGSLNGVPVETQPHLLVVGPTGSGKSLRVLVPGALLWCGPRVIISSKADFMEEVITRGIHKRGRLYVLDLTGEISECLEWLKDVDYVRVISDPCALVDNDDDALEMASLLINVGQLAASGGSSGGGGDTAAFWETQTRKLLAGLILAGRASGRGINWVVEAVGQHIADDENDPSWDNGFVLLHDENDKPTSRLAREIRIKRQVDAKMRDGLKATMANALSPWDNSVVSGYGRSDVVPFSPDMLEGDDEPTLAIISSMDGPGVGAAVAAVETIIRHWRRNLPRGLKRVLLSIDEFANTCPLPKASTYLSEARGLGVNMVLALQSVDSQLKEKYGEARAAAIKESTPAVLILRGSPGSQDLLESAAWWDGEEERLVESLDFQGHATTSTERVPRTSAQALLPKNLDEGRLLIVGQKGLMVEIPGIWAYDI